MMYYTHFRRLRFIGIVGLAIFVGPHCFGQFGKVLHQTFDLATVNEVTIEIGGEVEYEDWQGNILLVETTIKLDNAKKSYLNHFLEEGRYDIEAKENEDHLSLTSKTLNRHPIQTKSGVIVESVSVRIHIPQEFDRVEGQLLRKVPLEPGEVQQSTVEPVVKK